jgi:hypothetical protein
MTGLVLLLAAALAETPTTLPGGSSTAYGGVGVSTFEYGSSGLIRDRVWFARVEGYGAVGLSDRWQLAAYVPLVHSWVVEIADRGPCPRPTDYCDPLTTVGDVVGEVRFSAVDARVKVAPALALHTNAWNKGSRHRFDAVGYAETGAVARVVVGSSGTLAKVAVKGLVYASLDLVLGTVIDQGTGPIKAPLDTASAGIELVAAPGPWTLQVGAHGMSKLGGLAWGEPWVANYYNTDTQWLVLRYQTVRAELKVSRSIGSKSGVHMSVSRAVWADSGPKDMLDVSLGVHRWFPGS